jgi:DNA-binding transcriptional MerR regulator
MEPSEAPEVPPPEVDAVLLTREEVDSRLPAMRILSQRDPADARFETVDDPRIPPGQMYFKIGEIARITGIKQYVIRYWESVFPFLKPAKTNARQRRYRRVDFAMLLKIARLRYEEQLTIDRTRRIILEDLKPDSASKARTRASARTRRIEDGSAAEGIQRALADMRKMVLELLEAVEE